jgi:trehalose 6-phosphate synthase/phosphatase
MTIWIHDNNLIMVPFLIKKVYVNSNIGFFFHSPFPSSDIFRMFKFRFEIL